VADLGIDRRGAPGVWTLPHTEGLGAMPPAGVQGQSPRLRVWGQSPQKLKPKNTLEASQNSGDVNVKCIVDNPLLIFAQFLYLQRVCANLLSVVSLTRPTHVSKIIDYFLLKQQQTSGRTQKR